MAIDRGRAADGCRRAPHWVRRPARGRVRRRQPRGAAIDPEVDEESAGHSKDEAATVANDGSHASPGEAPPGLAVAENGLRLVPDETSFDPDAETTLRFLAAAE